MLLLGCCVLHKILRSLSRDSYTPYKSVDVVNDEGEILNGAWRDEGQSPFIDLDPHLVRKATYNTEEARDYFKEYFQTNGSVPWQYKHIY